MAKLRLADAITLREECVKQFNQICEEGRTSPVPIQAYVDNRILYMKACELVYDAMWFEVADTGVQVLRAPGDIRDIDTKPTKK